MPGPVISSFIAGVSHDGPGSVLIHKHWCRIMVKLKDTFSTEMGDFKLYNAWHIKAGSTFLFGKKQLLNISLSCRSSHADADADAD